MARKPNYSFEKRERERAKAAKKAARAAAKAEKAEARKAGLTDSGGEDEREAETAERSPGE